MTSKGKRPIPDGRIRLLRLLSDEQKDALRAVQPEGLLILNFYEIEIAQPETWIEYWFDETRISEDDLRALITRVVTSV
jgi:hypothetical protein